MMPPDPSGGLEPCPNCTTSCELCHAGLVTEAILIEYRLLFGKDGDFDTDPTPGQIAALRKRHDEDERF